VHCSVKNAAVLCKNHHERVTQTWTSPSEEEDEKHFGHPATFWFGTFTMLFNTTGCAVHHQNTQRWTLCCWTAYKLAFLRFWEIFCVSINYASSLSLHIDSTNSMIELSSYSETETKRSRLTYLWVSETQSAQPSYKLWSWAFWLKNSVILLSYTQRILDMFPTKEINWRIWRLVVDYILPPSNSMPVMWIKPP